MTIRSTGSIVCRFDRLGREIGFDPLTKGGSTALTTLYRSQEEIILG